MSMSLDGLKSTLFIAVDEHRRNELNLILRGPDRGGIEISVKQLRLSRVERFERSPDVQETL
jgi:hypothetical protein